KPRTHYHLCLAMSFIRIVGSCKKNSDITSPPPPVDSSAEAKKARDTALLLSRDYYLWYNQIPPSFDPQSYADPAGVMIALRNYRVDPVFSRAVDNWSFGVLKSDWNQLSGGVGSGNNISSESDFCFKLVFLVEGDLRVGLVERLSPAGLAGVQRSWRVTKVNGNSNITTGNIPFLNNALNSTSSTFTFTKPDGTSVEI